MADPRVRRLIVQAALRHGIDPAAALAVASVEGGVRFGAVGDGGTSFGPFQLHIGGANPHRDPKRASSFANSAQGIDYAIRKMAESGAHGLKGHAAVDAIVRRFERPAAPGPEIERAMGMYGSFGKASKVGLGATQSNFGGGSLDSGALGSDAFKSILVSQLLQQSQQLAAGGQIDPSAILSLAMARKQFEAAAQTFGPEPTSGSLTPGQFQPGGGWGGSKGVADSFASIGRSTGLKVVSEKRDRQHTASGGVSDHWTGSKTSYAYDLSNGSAPTKQMDRAAIQMMAQLGQKYDGKSPLVFTTTRDGYRIQILYRTDVGGNHHNHIHVGVRRIK